MEEIEKVQVGLSTVNSETVSEEKKPSFKFNVRTAREIQDLKTKETDFIVPGILSSGMCLFGGPAKHAKSWMCLDLAITVATGGEFWGRKVQKGTCLYLALEDNDERIKARVNQLLDDDDAPDNLFITYYTRTVGTGLIDDLEAFMAEHPDTRLVIVDVLQMIRDEKKKGQTDYAGDYDCLIPLKHFAEKYHIAVLAVTHTRKTGDAIAIHTISGSVGVIGSVDSILLLIPSKKDDGTAILKVQSRDVQEQNLAIEFDSATCRWNYIGTENELNIKSNREKYHSSEVIKFIKELLNRYNGSWSGTCEEMLSLATEMYDHPIAKSASALSRKINQFDQLLDEIDAIVHEKPDPNGGVKGRIHTFTVKSIDASESILEDAATMNNDVNGYDFWEYIPDEKESFYL